MEGGSPRGRLSQAIGDEITLRTTPPSKRKKPCTPNGSVLLGTIKAALTPGHIVSFVGAQRCVSLVGGGHGSQGSDSLTIRPGSDSMLIIFYFTGEIKLFFPTRTSHPPPQPLPF